MPLFTRYSLYTLRSPSQFSHERASRELGYQTRPLEETIADTVRQLISCMKAVDKTRILVRFKDGTEVEQEVERKYNLSRIEKGLLPVLFHLR